MEYWWLQSVITGLLMSGLFAPSAQDKYFHPSYCLPRPDDCSNLFLASLNHSSYNHIPFTYTERPWMTRNYLMNQTEKYFISSMFMNISGLVCQVKLQISCSCIRLNNTKKKTKYRNNWQRLQIGFCNGSNICCYHYQ